MITICDNEPLSLSLSVMFQDDAERARSTASSCVYGVPPTGRKVPDGWQKTGEILLPSQPLLGRIPNTVVCCYSDTLEDMQKCH